MSSIKQDKLTGEYVVIAKSRGERPITIGKEGVVCPFCPGNEHLTPDQTYEKNYNGKWSVRAFPNKYPAVEVNYGEIVDGYGHHELLIDTPNHDEKLQDYSSERMFDTINALKCRVQDLAKDEKIQYIQIFKNVGRNAGASQPHSHWQIVAVDFLPQRQQIILEKAKRHRELNSSCIVCDLVNDELKHTKRIIKENEMFVAVTSHAGKFMYEVSIFPKEHIHSITGFTSKQIELLSEMLKDMVNRISKLLNDAPYNLLILDAPVNCNDFYNWHWHMQIVPRFGRLAGFELSTGCYLNEVDPEDAAESLRLIK